MALNPDLLAENGLCSVCGTSETPCCDYGNCQAIKGTRGVTMCIHCGGELIEIEGKWYHHSQFEHDVLGQPQDYV